MAEATQVFPLGYRITDTNGKVVSGAKIKFRAAGPGAPKTVFADAALTIPLGTVVRTRSDGLPVVSAGSSTTTLIYVGEEPYHIEITSADDAIIVPAQDNVKGAPVLTPAEVVIPPLPVIATGSNLTLTAAHLGRLINANNNTLTFTSAVTLGDGWHVRVRNGQSSGQVILAAGSGVSFEGSSFTARALLPGEAMHIACDGTAFRVVSHTPPLLSPQGPGVVLIADRVSAAPGGPTPGARYIVEAAFDAFSDHQIIEATGSGFNVYTPPTDCGWVAYVQDEDRYYAFKASAWVDTLNTLRIADMPAGTVVGRAYAETTATTTLADDIPEDDSIPQQDEGTEILTVSITPQKAANRIRVTVTGYASMSGSSGDIVVALFRDAIDDALDARATASVGGEAADNDKSGAFALVFEHSPGVDVSTTYKVRAGTTNGTARLNADSSGNRMFGGASRATLTLEEIQT